MSDNPDLSDPKIRGERVKKLRNMANLTRRAMCEKSTIKPQTLIGWEIARHGGLSKVGANKVISRVAQEGVICTPEWLLHGIGQGPTIIPDYDQTAAIVQPDRTAINDVHHDETQNIIKELQLFKKQHNNTIEFIVKDDAMLPVFTPGDYIAGIKFYDNIDKLINYDCIVQLKSGEILFRTIKEGKTLQKITLCCSNYRSTIPNPVIYDAEVLSAAPVIWHRKNLIQI